MKRFILTISREFGCNAREIGRGIASKLGVPFYDKDLVDMAAAKAGLQTEMFGGADEILDKSEKYLLKSFGYGSSTSFYSEKAIKAQSDVIRELANKNESCVFFGRCSDYVLREYPNVMNVFLYSPMEARISHMAEGYDLSEKTAEKLIKRIDKQRHNYYKYVTGRNRGDRDLKHLMIDVHEYGTEGVVDIIYNTTMMKFK